MVRQLSLPSAKPITITRGLWLLTNWVDLGSTIAQPHLQLHTGARLSLLIDGQYGIRSYRISRIVSYNTVPKIPIRSNTVPLGVLILLGKCCGGNAPYYYIHHISTCFKISMLLLLLLGLACCCCCYCAVVLLCAQKQSHPGGEHH